MLNSIIENFVKDADEDELEWANELLRDGIEPGHFNHEHGAFRAGMEAGYNKALVQLKDLYEKHN